MDKAGAGFVKQAARSMRGKLERRLKRQLNQIISVRPSTRLDFRSAACRCLPQRKHDRDAAVLLNGEPGAFAAKRRPSSVRLVEITFAICQFSQARGAVGGQASNDTAGRGQRQAASSRRHCVAQEIAPTTATRSLTCNTWLDISKISISRSSYHDQPQRCPPDCV